MDKSSVNVNQRFLEGLSNVEMDRLLAPMDPLRRVLLRRAFRDKQITPYFVRDVRRGLQPMTERRQA